MSIKRVALVFDPRPRPETTGSYCLRALQKRLEVQHLLPEQVASANTAEFDLFLRIDDGLRSPWPDHLHPSAYWAIDTHMDFEWALEQSRKFDVVFAAQRDGADRLLSEGISTAKWLPLACDPDMHRPHDLPDRWDVSFVGHVVRGERQRLLDLVQKHVPNSFVGQCYFEEMAKVYSQSRIVFNRSVKNDINMRVFEALACGALLVTNDLAENGLEELFRDGVHCATYRDDEELLDKLRYFLAHNEVRERIADRGRAEAVRNHTYRHRMETILGAVMGDFQSVSVAVPRTEAAKNGVTKDRTYYEFDRPDVLGLVPESAKRILDIGCGAGRLGAAIKERQSAHVTGIEMDPMAAQRAGKALDDVRQGDVQRDEMDFPQGAFDCVICADVLEHLEAPHVVLEKVHRWLSPDGCLVTSLPNVRNHGVVNSLLAGNWTYEAAGLLDSDHVRFFTRREIEKLLFRQGFAPKEQRIVPGAGFDEWLRAGRPRRVEAGTLQIETASVAEAEEFFAYQYLFRSTPVARESALTSIVLVTHNQLTYTRACVESLFACTSEPFELIVVDNASSDGTSEYIQSLGARLIRNEENVGFPIAANQGIQVVTGDAVLLLNNDTLLTTGWLERLRAALRSNEKIGLVGPCTNCTAGRQRVDVEYDLTSLDNFAWDWRKAHFGQVQLVPELTGFCLLIDRLVIEEIGLLDERFENGVYEDIDFCRRAREAGFELGIAADAFVHHFGHKSYQAAGVDQDVLAVANEAKFREKWNLSARDEKAEERIRAFPYRTPRSLPWEDDFDPLRKVLKLVPDGVRQALVFVEDPFDLWLCEELRRVFGAAVTVCSRDEIAGSSRISWGANAPVSESRRSDRSTLIPRGGTPFEHLRAETLGDRSESFDVVILPRLDAHREPVRIVQLASRLLRSEGELICHTQNVRTQDRIAALLKGTWPTPWSNSQLRFFSRRELEKLLFSASLRVSAWIPLYGAEYAEWRTHRHGNVARIGNLSLTSMPPHDLEELFTSDFVVRAARQPTTDYGLTSIVIVTHNQWKYTKKCIESIRMRTTVPYEIIVVDNGSSDQTVSWLKSQPDLRLIRNSENRGFPAAANQGIEAAQGRNILLLNNDTIVTTAWLRRMLDAYSQDPRIGLAGPCTNNVSGPQQVPVGYDLSELDGFAWDWGKEYQGDLRDVNRLVGFCLLIRREVIDEIGLLDERFGIGCFEDDDYCRRAIDAGYKCVIARDAFVHHFGSRTFLGSQVDFAGILERNQRLFEEKWNSSLSIPNHSDKNGQKRNGMPAPRTCGIAVGEDGAFRLVPKPVRMSLCMIVRDNEHTIRPCLESIRPYVDEMIIVDTGSKDRTPEICKELGARVENFPWCDDFSAARNESLKHAQGEWMFWMDSDDTIPPECGRKLRELVEGEHADSCLGYVMQVHCPGAKPEDLTVVDHVKLFRNRPDLRFEFRIHEQILPAIRWAGGEVEFTDIYVVHSGSDQSILGQRRKLERDFRILELDLGERPDHPFVLFNLGMTCSEAGRLEDARRFLNRCLEVSTPQESHLRKAYAILVAVLMRLEQLEAAQNVCEAGLKQFQNDAELLFRRAMLHHAAGRFTEARDDYLTLLKPQSERHFSSRDVGILGYKARHNLALVFEDLGQNGAAREQWGRILKERPGYAPALSALGRFAEPRT